MSSSSRRPARAKASSADPTDGIDAPGAPFAPSRPYVVVFEGSSARSFILPFGEETLIGRAEDCTVRLDDAGVPGSIYGSRCRHRDERCCPTRGVRTERSSTALGSARGPAFRPIEEEVRELEKGRMVAALLASNGNQKRAAELIGMLLRTFVTKLKQYDLRDKTQGST